MLKKHVLPVSIIYTIILTALSLAKVNEVTEDLPDNSDKLFHALAYAIFTMLWFFTCFYKLKFNKVRALTISALFSVLFGIIIELLQGGLTVNRQADFYDVIANTTGTLIAIVGITMVIRGVKK